MNKKRIALAVETLAIAVVGFVGANVYASRHPSCEVGDRKSVVRYANPSFSTTFCVRDVHLTLPGKMH